MPDTMTQFLALCDDAHAQHMAEGDEDAAAGIELLREYVRNPEFRDALSDRVWEQTKNA